MIAGWIELAAICTVVTFGGAIGRQRTTSSLLAHQLFKTSYHYFMSELKRRCREICHFPQSGSKQPFVVSGAKDSQLFIMKKYLHCYFVYPFLIV
jgi:hypothetical protein